MNRKKLEKFEECMIHFMEIETKVSLCNSTPIVAFDQWYLYLLVACKYVDLSYYCS
jgi:hypothetical protein